MMTGNEIRGALIEEQKILPELLEACISKYIQETNFRCYIRPAKVNGHPIGYCGAKTFKIIEVKKRGKRK